MKNKILLLTVILVVLASVFCTWQYIQPPAVALKPAPIARKPDPNRKPEPNRCEKKFALQASLLLNGEILWTKPLTEIVSLSGSFILEKGRHKGSRAIPVDAFLMGHKSMMTLELLPCRGEPLRYAASDLRAQPARYILVVNNRGIFKLIEKEGDSYTAKPLLKNLMQIRLSSNAELKNSPPSTPPSE